MKSTVFAAGVSYATATTLLSEENIKKFEKQQNEVREEVCCASPAPSHPTPKVAAASRCRACDGPSMQLLRPLRPPPEVLT